MLIKFQFKNYRSFRDEAVLSMEASGLSPFKECLIPMSSTIKLLPAAAIYGKNGGGKSFLYETKASMSSIPMRRMCLRCPIIKKGDYYVLLCLS